MEPNLDYNPPCPETGDSLDILLSSHWMEYFAAIKNVIYDDCEEN